jgi:hypothetical protein
MVSKEKYDEMVKERDRLKESQGTSGTTQKPADYDATKEELKK